MEYTGNGQIQTQDPDRYVAELAKAWRNIASWCAPRARLIVRIGSLPSIPVDARDLLRQSLRDAQAGWRIAAVRAAGSANYGKRQAMQFGCDPGVAETEWDIFATLEG